VVREDDTVFVTETVTVTLVRKLADRSPDRDIVSVGVTVAVLQDDDDDVEMREGRGMTEPLAETIDVLVGACDFVSDVLEL